MTPGHTRTVVSPRLKLKRPVPEEVEAGIVEDGPEEAAAGVVEEGAEELAVLIGEKGAEEISAGVGEERAEEEMTAGAATEDVAEEATEEGAGEEEMTAGAATEDVAEEATEEGAGETKAEEAGSLSLEETISGCGKPFLACDLISRNLNLM
ncbi:cancer/testis antigen family 47 member C1-like [Montipora capricornis]|uniref:cancer/testis antigen family 47 member C1-like n=1 Tax=Montipora capricornis TaxID=246305 RepID=UPI0035F14566